MLKITEIETFLVFANWRNWVFVKISTDEGIAGLGEASLEGKEKTTEAAVHELKRFLIGRDPFQVELNCHEMYRNSFYRGGVVLNTAISGVEQALWDIIGKKLRLPVYNLLGGACRRKIRAYANGWYWGGTNTPKDFIKRAVKVVEDGYTALKWDPFSDSDLFIDRKTASKAVESVKDVRDAVGDDIDLLIEVHGRLSPRNAIDIARKLEKYQIFWYEEPVPPENVEDTARVASAVNVPIATGERLYTKYAFRNLFEKRAADIVQPDLCHAGGILECKKIAAMAESYHVAVAPHNPNGPVCFAASVQLDACITNFLIQEYFVDSPEWLNEMVVEPFEIKNGYIETPSKPGLGIELNERELSRHPYKPVDLHLYREDWYYGKPTVRSE